MFRRYAKRRPKWRRPTLLLHQQLGGAKFCYFDLCMNHTGWIVKVRSLLEGQKKKILLVARMYIYVDAYSNSLSSTEAQRYV